MTRPFVSFHVDPDVAVDYLLQVGKAVSAPPQPIGGTVPWRSRAATIAALGALPCRNDVARPFMTVTISLPEGMTLGRAAWRPVVGIALGTLFQEPAERMCWLGFRHRNTSCDHVHLALTSCTLAGRPLYYPEQNARCEAAQIRLCRHLGLDPPDYPVPGAGPRNRIFIPTRRITEANRTLVDDLRTVLLAVQPETTTALATALRARGHGVSLRRDQARGEMVFCQGELALSGGLLSPELAPGQMGARFALAAALRLARPRVAEKVFLAALAAEPGAADLIDSLEAKLVDIPRATGAAAWSADDHSAKQEPNERRMPDVLGGQRAPERGAAGAGGTARKDAQQHRDDPGSDPDPAAAADAAGPAGRPVPSARRARGVAAAAGVGDRGPAPPAPRAGNGAGAHYGPARTVGDAGRGRPARPRGDAGPPEGSARRHAGGGGVLTRLRRLRAWARETGTTLAIRYRPADLSFSLRRPDGGGLRLLPRRLILEAAPNGALAGLQRLAQDLAGHLGWIPGAPGWPPAPQRGTILAVPPAESHRAWADVLARTRWVADGARPGWLDAISANSAGSREGDRPPPDLFGRMPAAADLTPLAPPVVMVTPAGWAAIRRNPKRALERLATFARRHPGAEAVESQDEPHLPTLLPLTMLIGAVQTLAAAKAPAKLDLALTHGGGAHQGGVDVVKVRVGTPAPGAGRAEAGDHAKPDAENVRLERSHTAHPSSGTRTSELRTGQDTNQQGSDPDRGTDTESAGSLTFRADPLDDPGDDLAPF